MVPHYSICIVLALLAMVTIAVAQPSPEASSDLTKLGICYRSNDTAGTMSCLASLAGYADSIRSPLRVLEARVLMKQGKRNEAITVLEELRQDHTIDEPGQLSATTLLADILYDAKQFERAIGLFQAVLTSFPHHRERYELRYRLADSLQQAGQKTKAVEAFLSLAESRLQKRPARLAFNRLYRQFVANTFPQKLDHAIWLRWGRLLLKKRKYTNALDVVIPMIAQTEKKKNEKSAKKGKKTGSPGNRTVGPLTDTLKAEALILGGEIELRRKNGWWARRLFLRATELDVTATTKARALYLAGDAMYRISLWSRALGHYRSVLAKYPKSDFAPAALFKMAAVAKKEGHQQRATSHYRSLLKRFPKSWFSQNVAWELGRDCYDAKRWRQAATLFRDYCKSAPSNRLVSTVRYWQAKALSQYGDWKGVRRTLQQLLDERPLPGMYHLAAARYLRRPAAKGLPKGLPMPRFDEYESALMLLSSFVPPRPQEGWVSLPEELSAEDIERVSLLKDSKLWESLSEELERLVYLNGSSAPLRNNLAWAYERLGDFPGAIEQAEIIIQKENPFATIKRGPVLDKLFPRPARMPFKKYCRIFKVHLPLAYSIAREESRFDGELVSWAGAKGVMQVMNSTGRWIAKTLKIKGFKPEKLYGPELNVRLGCWYLSYLGKRFKGLRDAPLLVMGSYNAGPGNMRRWLDAHSSPGGFEEFIESWHLEETQFYIKKVSRALICYELLDGPIDK